MTIVQAIVQCYSRQLELVEHLKTTKEVRIFFASPNLKVNPLHDWKAELWAGVQHWYKNMIKDEDPVDEDTHNL